MLATASGAVVASSAESPDCKNICVLGAGVVGLTCAIQLLEALPNARVTVVAEKVEGTTSHGAGGLW